MKITYDNNLIKLNNKTIGRIGRNQGENKLYLIDFKTWKTFIPIKEKLPDYYIPKVNEIISKKINEYIDYLGKHIDRLQIEQFKYRKAIESLDECK